MRPRLRLFAFLAIYWLSFMAISRILFLTYNYDYSDQLTLIEKLKTILYGLKMDLSLTGYVLMFVGLVLSISMLTEKNRWTYYTIHSFNIIFLVFSCAIIVIDLELYRHWGFRMNTTPLMYLGSEALGSVQASVMIKLTGTLILLLAAFFYIYIRIFFVYSYALPQKGWKEFAAMLFITGLMFLPIRGSLTVAPMNTGFVYFHKSKMYANHAAVNVIWNFLYSVRKSAHIVYPENFLDQEIADTYFKNVHPASDTTIHLFNTKRPNVILIILESFTADVVEPLGGLPGICPNLNKLCSEGILFNNFYASGDRTDKGLISILSGYPAQPQTSIIKYPAKTQRLPYLAREVQKLGYRTSFVYGGDIDFANFRSYLTSCGFDHISFLDDFPGNLDESKWGVQDEFVMGRALTELDTTGTPFLQVILTQSSHEPFIVPMQPYIKGSDEESLFLNSCHYTDKCLGDYIKQAKQQPWWTNTVVMITADHGHRHPRNKKIQTKERFRIPLLMLGGALNTEDSVIQTFGNQTDIANTLLSQLDKPHPEFTFSKNLLGSPVTSFAAYFFNDGYGFVTPDVYIVYDNPGKQFIRKEGATEKDLDISKAYQQVLYSDYNKK